MPKRSPHIEREVRLLRQLQDVPGVVRLVEACTGVRHIYVVLEYLSGGELFERIKRHSRFGEPEARAIFHQLLAAVAELHSRGIVHRDLKVRARL